MSGKFRGCRTKVEIPIKAEKTVFPCGWLLVWTFTRLSNCAKILQYFVLCFPREIYMLKTALCFTEVANLVVGSGGVARIEAEIVCVII